MKRLLLFTLVLCGCIASICAQTQLGETVDSALYLDRIQLFGNIGYQSTAMRQDVSRPLAFGGSISDDAIVATFDKHKAINKAGFSYTSGLVYDHLNKSFYKNRLSWGLQFGVHQIHSSVYSKSLFGAIFRGTSEYKGDTIQLSGFNYSGRSLQKVGARIVDRLTGSFIALNLVQMGFFQDIDMTKGYIYQNPEATTMDIRLNGDWTSSSFPHPQHGFGFGIDAEYRFPVQLESSKKKVWFQVKVENLGAVRFANLKTYSIDTSFSYSGFSFSQLGQVGTLNFDGILDTLNVREKTKTTWKAIPTYLQVSKLINPQSNKRLQSFFGIRFYPFMNITPLIFVGENYSINSKWFLRLSGTYGGFGLFRVGTAVGYQSKQLSVVLGSDEPLSYLIKSFTGQSLSFRLLWAIGSR